MKFLQPFTLTPITDPGPPYTLGSFYLSTDGSVRWFGGTRLSTVMDLETPNQIVAVSKIFNDTVTFQGAITQTGAGSANFNGGDLQFAGRSLPRGHCGFQQITASSTATASTSVVNVTGLAPVATMDATRRYKVEAWVQLTSTVAGDRVGYMLRDGTTQIQGSFVTIDAASVGQFAYLSAIVNKPTSGAHTFNLGIYRNSGTGNVSVVAGAQAPSFVAVEDIGLGL